ncbi:MAG: efflux RND transporter periplasmic adaptor subunit [Pseudomonadota bacterium]
MRRNRVRFGVAPIFAAFAILSLAGCGEEQEKEADIVRPVLAVKVGDSAQFRRREFSGRAKGTREVGLSFRVPGQLLDFQINVGDEVTAGSVIGRLDPAPYQAEVNTIKANLQSAKATLTNAQQQYDRDEQLFKKGFVAQARLDQRTAKVREAQAQVASIDAQLERAELNLDYTTITAPFDGVVVATFAEQFEDIRAQMPIARVVDNSRIEMVVDIPENLISLVPQVKGATVVFDAFPDTKLLATVKEIGTEASETTRTYPVTLIMDQPPDIKILPGMAGKASASEDQVAQDVVEKTTEVPVSATFTDTGGAKTFVWVVNEGSGAVSKREIETGPLTNIGIEVRSGLKTGEWVVTAGVHSLKDGQVVRLLKQ